MTEAFPSVRAPLKDGTSVDATPRVLTAQFGDGYAAEAADGINNVTHQAKIAWKLSTEDKDIVIAFLEDMAGHKPFLFADPVYGAVRRWTCKQWSVSPKSGLYWSVTATFKEAFNP